MEGTIRTKTPTAVLKHKLSALWRKLPNFRWVFVYFWHHVDRLEKLLSKEQQLSRTQHFILTRHEAVFVLHTQYGPCGIPLTPMIRQQNYLLSTNDCNQIRHCCMRCARNPAHELFGGKSNRVSISGSRKSMSRSRVLNSDVNGYDHTVYQGLTKGPAILTVPMLCQR